MQTAFKKLSFTKCITKIDETTIDDAKQEVYSFIQKMKQLILMQI